MRSAGVERWGGSETLSHRPRNGDDFRRWIGDRVRGVEREADYFTAAARPTGRSPGSLPTG